MLKSQKVEVVAELKEKLAKAKSLVLADYRGLTHKQLEEIKKAMKLINAEFVITKNTLLKLASTNSQFQISISNIEGPTATLFSYEDEIAPFSVLAKFIKNFGLMQIKTGWLNNKALTGDEVLKIASLPSREILMATLVSRLKGPVYRLHNALSWNTRKLILTLKTASNKS